MARMDKLKQRQIRLQDSRLSLTLAYGGGYLGCYILEWKSEVWDIVLRSTNIEKLLCGGGNGGGNGKLKAMMPQPQTY